MPKALMLGNGNVLVGFDHFGQVKDFYFPYVGMENHVNAPYAHKMGVWADNAMHWLDNGSWTVHVDCQKETFSSVIFAENKHIQIELDFNDVIYNEKNILVRKVTVLNKSSANKSIKFFFHSGFEIYASDRGDTAFFDPHANVIIHYEGRRVFLMNAESETGSFKEWSIGLYGIESREGTYKDAEDGVLSKNPIEHGKVDSIIGLPLELKPRENKTIYYWIVVGNSHDEVHKLDEYVKQKTPHHLIQSTQDFWRAWMTKQRFIFHGLSNDVVNLFRKSLFYIRAHSDNRGAIIASGDSDMLQYGRDTYSYMWPRDGSISAIALDKVGDNHVAERFFEFCNDVLTPEGYFLHKYRADRSWGSSWHPWIREGVPTLPIQEDETALVLYALREHYAISKDIEFIEELYNPFIKKMADFLLAFRDEEHKLPRPSYDIWEEKFGVSTYTSSAVYGALMVAAEFATIFGKHEEAARYGTGAEEVRTAILSHLYDEKEKTFYKLINFQNGEKIIDKTADMSSAYGIFKFRVLPIDDPRIKDYMDYIRETLCCKTIVSGVSRYQNDNYYRISRDVPGNPWFVTTLWLAQYYITLAKKEEDLNEVKKWLDWAVKYAQPAGVLSEQLNPYTGEQLSAAPLTWSHSEFVITVTQYLEKLQELGICQTCYPLK